jgi:hypothetical protein
MGLTGGAARMPWGGSRNGGHLSGARSVSLRAIEQLFG